MEIVELLLIEENRDLISWLGGGLCIIGGALWTVFKYRRSTTSKEKSEDTGTSNFGGVSVPGTGNDLKDVTINTHIVQNRTGGVETTGLTLFFLGFVLLAFTYFSLSGPEAGENHTEVAQPAAKADRPAAKEVVSKIVADRIEGANIKQDAHGEGDGVVVRSEINAGTISGSSISQSTNSED